MDKYSDSALDNININEIIEILDDVEIIAHDKTIDFDSAKHIIDDEKMNNAVDMKTPVIYRTHTGMRAILYSQVLEKDTRGFHKEVMMLPSGKTNNTSALIRKIE